MKQKPADNRIRVPDRSIMTVFLTTDASASDLLPPKELGIEAISSYVRAKSASISLD